jgi:hypothetical protein
MDTIIEFERGVAQGERFYKGGFAGWEATLNAEGGKSGNL